MTELESGKASELIKLVATSSRAMNEIVLNNISHFNEIKMGSRLFTYGYYILLFNIAIRLLQWGMSYAGSLGFLRIGSNPDDIFFVGLLIIATIMMVGGLVANVYLIWNAQVQNQAMAGFVDRQLGSITAMEGQESARKTDAVKESASS